MYLRCVFPPPFSFIRGNLFFKLATHGSGRRGLGGACCALGEYTRYKYEVLESDAGGIV
jgi:hypothetical protein